jgi:23S rRNA (uracil1939-C5)-methyltransferase
MSTPQDLLGAELSLTVEAAALSGKTLSRLPDGRVVWLKGMLSVGDTGRFVITKTRSKSAEASLIELTERSSSRVEPFCPHVERCGGCPWQAISDEQQLRSLSDDLDRALSRAVGCERGVIDWSEPFVSAERAWRHTARLHLNGRSGELKLGFYGEDGLLSLDRCPTFAPTLNEGLAQLNATLLPQLKAQAEALKGTLRLSAARGACTGTASLELSEPINKPLAEQLEALMPALLGACQALHGLHLSYQLIERAASARQSSQGSKQGKGSGRDRSAKGKRGRGHKSRGSDSPSLKPKLKRVERSWGEAFNELVSPHPAQAFMQAHQEGNEALIAEVLRRVKGARSALELYAGSGNLSVALAERGGLEELSCVESDERALKALESLALERGLRGVKTVKRDLRDPPDALLKQFLSGRFEHLILDPPRAGAKELIERLAELALSGEAGSGPNPITYISCHPAALARDLERLVSAGWRLERARLFHLFPHTGHAELCVTLTRGQEASKEASLA